MTKLSKFRYRRILYLALACALLVGVVGGSDLATAKDKAQGQSSFDFDKGNAVLDVIFPHIAQPLREGVSPTGMDASLIVRVTAINWAAIFDAYAPYHPTAVGIYSNLGRRPASERATNKNRNIAIIYATYRVLDNLLPKLSDKWRAMLTDVGLDPDDNQENNQTAVGIGNLAAKNVIANRENDGMNQLGNEGGRKYNRQPYADYTGYKPVNTAYELRDPSRWQPNIAPIGNGAFQIQQFVTPQLGITKPFGDENPTDFHAPPPVKSDVKNLRDYKAQADEVLAASAHLTDEQKMAAEYFNDKFIGLSLGTFSGLRLPELSFDDFIVRFATANIANFDTSISIWHDKYTYDAVRPFSAIRYLYGNRPVTAWGGPGKGTVKDLPANQWQSYLNVADHPEYPSSSTSLCATAAEVGRRFDNSDKVDISQSFAKGSSLIEPGVTPAKDITLHWSTWTDWANDCGLSRFWGGVHFLSAIAAGKDVGTKIGDQFYDFMQRHIQGKI